ncbi:Protein of unknown function [Lactobacillus delbrueckii subsp. lactis]|nr:Protein of unknown function [Lactobacillus delbrueckii subsp. lactis]
MIYHDKNRKSSFNNY